MVGSSKEMLFYMGATRIMSVLDGISIESLINFLNRMYSECYGPKSVSFFKYFQ